MRTPVDQSGGDVVDYGDYPDYYGGDPVGNPDGVRPSGPGGDKLLRAGVSPRTGRPSGRSTAISAATGTSTRIGGSRRAGAVPAAAAGQTGARAGSRRAGARANRGGPPLPPETGIRGWWHRRARWFRWLTVLSLTMLVLLLAAVVGLLYAASKVEVPEPSVASQVSLITYANGNPNDPIAKLGSVNRTDVKLADISLPARNAVLAAEDKRFYSEPGISYRGIARALYTDLRGGSVQQGGSTITQQYAKNAYLTQDRTISRKLREIALAVKLDKKYSKDQILELYLNRIYFGRGAYGIEAAAKTYFGVHAANLTAEQGAVIAGLIRSPNVLDPRVSPHSALKRWKEVLGTMDQEGSLKPGELAADLTLPKTLPIATSIFGVASPQAGYIRDQVKRELATHGISADAIARGGLKIITTLDKSKETAATLAVAHVTGAAAPDVQTGLVAVQPGTGKVLAWYGGSIYGQTTRPDPNNPGHTYADYSDNLTDPSIQPGSSFKPIVLVTALANGIPLSQTYDGHSPLQGVQGYPQGLHNFQNAQGQDEQFGQINLVDATANSVNTVYVKLGQQVGIPKVEAMARNLGVTAPLGNVNSLPLGTKEIKPVEMVGVYSTFASGGIRATPHLVEKVYDRTGKVIYQDNPDKQRVLAPDVVANASFAMQDVLTHGTAAGDQLAGGRLAAGKTGTTTDNKSALFCGYTPQLATCTVMFRDKKHPLQNILGVPEVTGGTLPAATWKAFMDAALAGQPNLPFPPASQPVSATPTQAPVTEPPASQAPTQAPAPTPTHRRHRPTPAPTVGPTTPNPQPTLPGLPTFPGLPTQTGPPRNTAPNGASPSTG